MAWIEQRRRADGGLTARVIWRPGGARDATRVWETFGAGSDAQNLARADGFKRMVEAAGQRWPDGWVKGEGFVRPPDVADPMTPPPSFDKIGEEYVRQIVDLSSGQRKRYLGQLQVLAHTPVRGSLIHAARRLDGRAAVSGVWVLVLVITVVGVRGRSAIFRPCAFDAYGRRNDVAVRGLARHPAPRARWPPLAQHQEVDLAQSPVANSQLFSAVRTASGEPPVAIPSERCKWRRQYGPFYALREPKCARTRRRAGAGSKLSDGSRSHAAQQDL